MPGVDAVALSFTNPLEPERAFPARFQIPGVHERPRAEQPIAHLHTVTPGFFDTFRIPLVRGRMFTDRDVKESSGVAKINETLARQIFGDTDPVGHRLEGPNFWGDAGYPYPWEIVGVVGDVRSGGLNEPPAPAMYFAFEQAPMGNMRLIVRTLQDPMLVAPAIRQQVWQIDPDLPVDNLYTMEQLISQSVATPRLVMAFVGAFALLALVLAAVGIYGVMSYVVGQRTSEFGIRLALGADGDAIVSLVVRQGLVVAVAGIGLGLPLSGIAGRAIASFLYGITPSDPVTLTGVTTVLVAVSFAACFVPARRATRVDLVVALRSE